MKLFTVKKENIDFQALSSTDIRIVSFDKSVLDKYSDKSSYKIELNENAGTLKSINDGWALPIDVGTNHVSTFLYKLSSLPNEDKSHFETKNIYPKELGDAAHRRWTQGKP
jgi:hypothetical protein